MLEIVRCLREHPDRDVACKAATVIEILTAERDRYEQNFQTAMHDLAALQAVVAAADRFLEPKLGEYTRTCRGCGIGTGYGYEERHAADCPVPAYRAARDAARADGEAT